MKVLSFGSMNIDNTYSVDHFVQAGETESSLNLELFPGGKGLNQAIALAKAGLEVHHAGCIGQDGLFLKNLLEENGVNTDAIQVLENIKTGHAIIQKNKEGNNCILLFGGANQQISKAYIDSVLLDYDEGDYLFIQNEINNLDYLVNYAYRKGMKIVLNPSPFNSLLNEGIMSKITYFILNEVEASQILQQNIQDYEQLAYSLLKKYPDSHIVLTLGDQGAIYLDQERYHRVSAIPAKVVDTTAAGDTFTGYFFASLIQNYTVPDCLKYATVAASIAITREGAATSIPLQSEVYPR